MNPPKEHKGIFVVLSVLLAVAFWLYIRTVEDPDTENSYDNIPVQISGENVLEAQGMLITGMSTDRVSLSWTGAFSVISHLEADNISVSVDVSRIMVPGTYDLRYTINYPSSVSQSALTVQSDTEYISVTVERLGSKVFSIEPVLSGGIAEGYLADDFTVSPETVSITGTEEEIGRIAAVRVVLEGEDRNKSFAGDLPLVLLDKDGNTLDIEGLRMDTETAYVTLPVMMVKELELSIEFQLGGGVTENNYTPSIDPQSITVAGPEEIVQALQRISLGSIDLSKVMDNLEESYTIYLPAGVENISGINTATVQVEIHGLTTRAFDVRDIQVYNPPEGFDANVKAEVCTVVVRGTEEALERLHESQLSIVVDLSEYTDRGTHRVPVQVLLSGSSEVGVIGEYSVVVSITRSA